MSIAAACQYMGISRQFTTRKAMLAKAAKASALVALEHTQRIKQPRVGTRKLYHLLKPSLNQLKINLGLNGGFSVLRGASMLVQPKRSYHKTTHSHHRFRKHLNLLKTGAKHITANGCEQVWGGDITYIPTKNQTVYLSLITDAYSRKIVGHHVHDSLRTEQVAKALMVAVKARQTHHALIHHSDRGSQYCCGDYQAIHMDTRITCSMTDGYDCYQNALAERVNGYLIARVHN